MNEKSIAGDFYKFLSKGKGENLAFQPVYAEGSFDYFFLIDSGGER
jgi:hypothetical protein